MRLFALPFAGSGASLYRSWTKMIPAEIDFIPIQLPGREIRIRDPLIDNLDELTSQLVPAIAPLLDKPYAIFGYSMGALVAFETARVLEKNGHPKPKTVFAASRQAPSLPPQAPPFFDLPDDEFWAQVKKLNGSPDEVFEKPELLELIGPVLRNDLRLCDSYSHDDDTLLSCPIRAYGSEHDLLTPLDALQAWEHHTENSFTTKVFPGDHFFIHHQTEALVADISQTLLSPSGPNMRRDASHSSD